MAAWREEAQQHQVPLEIPEALISNDALRIVEKLNEMGHLSYVVGGCVRDLALCTEPKDFDVVTTAKPQQVRRARYARIIGRRFRCACPLRTPPPDRGGDLRACPWRSRTAMICWCVKTMSMDRRWRTPGAISTEPTGSSDHFLAGG